MKYKGIELEVSDKPVRMTHSFALDMIQGQSSTQNMDWTDTLGSLPWGTLNDPFFDQYDAASSLFSLINMNYQVCNGGISQYFFNGYHEAREPFSDNDVERYDIDDQKRDFKDLVDFGRSVFPERIDENYALAVAARAFQDLWFEENVAFTETIYCEEDEFIYDDELDEEVENPDYFEPYDEEYYEDVIHGDNNFDETFYKANGYMEELFELRAQYICKDLIREVEKNKDKYPEMYQALRDALPKSAFLHVNKPSLDNLIQSAENKASNRGASSESRMKTPDFEH